MSQHRIIPVYSSSGEVEAFLVFPYLFNRSGEWIGCVTAQREVYSVMGNYVGSVTNDPRIVRRRSESDLRPPIKVTPPTGRLNIPANLPLAPMLSDLPLGLVDVLVEEPERLHTLDSGELREDMD